MPTTGICASAESHSKSPSKSATIGLRNGDVLTGVGGQSVSDPARAIQVLSTLRNQSNINLTVVRGGEPLHLEYNIR